MADNNLTRVTIINFVSSFIISIVICDILYSFHLYEVMYIGNLFGLYFFVVFGLKNLVNARKITNNRQRFIFALIGIVIFDIAFLILIPFIFGDVLSTSDYLVLIFNGVRFDLVLTAVSYLVVFAVIMLYFNYRLYKMDDSEGHIEE